MLDVGWTELLVIAVVLIVVVGPKDLPPMLRAFGKTMARFRSVAGEFQRQFNDALKEADLDDVRQTLTDAKRFHPANAIREAIAPLRDAGVDLQHELQKATTTPSPVASEPVTLADALLPADATAEDLPETAPAVASTPAPAPAAAPQPAAPAAVAAPASAAAPAPAPAAIAPAPATPATAPEAAAVTKPRAPRKKVAAEAPISGATEEALAAQADLAAKPKRARKTKKDEA